MLRVEGVVANIPGRDTQHGYSGGFGDFSFEAVQVAVYGCWLPAGVGEYRVVDLGKGACGRQGEEGAGLNSRAQGEGAELRLIGNGKS